MKISGVRLVKGKGGKDKGRKGKGPGWIFFLGTLDFLVTPLY